MPGVWCGLLEAEKEDLAPGALNFPAHPNGRHRSPVPRVARHFSPPLPEPRGNRGSRLLRLRSGSRGPDRVRTLGAAAVRRPARRRRPRTCATRRAGAARALPLRAPRPRPSRHGDQPRVCRTAVESARPTRGREAHPADRSRQMETRRRLPDVVGAPPGGRDLAHRCVSRPRRGLSSTAPASGSSRTPSSPWTRACWPGAPRETTWWLRARRSGIGPALPARSGPSASRTAGAELPLETRGRLRIVGGADLPAPELQVEIRSGGRLVGIVDGWFDEPSRPQAPSQQPTETPRTARLCRCIPSCAQQPTAASACSPPPKQWRRGTGTPRSRT